ncbi:MAG: hypothetical protein Q9190_004035 [Brigantiaea leucoxantha]
MFGFGDPQPLELPKDDNLWGFGQCITVILLTLPFLSMCNNYFETKEVARSKQQTTLMSSLQTTIQNTITEEDPQRSTKLIKMGSNKSFIENNFGSSVQNGGHTQQTTRTDITSQAREQEAAVDEDNRLLTLDYQYRDGNAIAMNTPVTGSFGRSERGSSPLEGPITSAQSLYRFEWFRLLIAQVLLASLGIALGIVFLFSTTRPEPDVIDNLGAARNWSQCGQFVSHMESLESFAEQYWLKSTELLEASR